MSNELQRKILIAEDDENLRRFYQGVLNDAGYAVDSAGNGVEALGKIKKNRYELIIAGVKMPGLDGIGLFLDAVKLSADLKGRFLFTIKNTCEDPEAGAALSSMSGNYLVRPYDINDLLKKIEDAINAQPSAPYVKSGGREAERRLDRRFCWNEDCLMEKVPPKGRPFASTADISRNGIRIRYMGSPIRQGLRIAVALRSLDFKSLATVVWSWALNSESISGLRLIEPIPASSIMAAVNARPFIPPLISTNRE